MGQRGSKSHSSLQTEGVKNSSKIQLGSFRRERSPTCVNSARRTVANSRNGQHTRNKNNDSKKNRVDMRLPPANFEKNLPTSRKPAVNGRLAINGSAKRLLQTTLTKDREVKESNAGYEVSRLSPEIRDQAAQTDVGYESFRVERVERLVQALSITVQYLTHQLDALSASKFRKDYEDMKAEWLVACSEVDRLRAVNAELEARIETESEGLRRNFKQAHEDLETRHADKLKALEATIKDERRKFEEKLRESLSVAAEEHRLAITRLRAKYEGDLSRKDEETKRRCVVHDQGAALRAEIESLRSVLELKSQENAQLRSELDAVKREIEDKRTLRLKVDGLEARCEDLKAQLEGKESYERQISHENEVLLESFHQVSKHNKRLSQRNEELQWRLRQKNEVVSVLANQLAPPSHRLSRSLDPEHIDHSFVSDKNTLEKQSTSMVKFMVEKGDSVSWTLEIDEPTTGTSDGSFGIPPKKIARPESHGGGVSRQGSLRLAQRRPNIDARARSKSVSVTDSTRVEESTWLPQYNSTPVCRRRPRSDPSTSSTSSSSSAASGSSSSSTSSSSSSSSASAGVSAATVGAVSVKVEDCSGAGQRPQEAGGEAMISEETSASSSEDESSNSSDIPRLAMQFAWCKSID